LDGLIDRHPQLVRKNDRVRIAAAHLVANVPPPLLADDVNAQRTRCRRRNARLRIDPEAIEQETQRRPAVDCGHGAADRYRIVEQQKERDRRKHDAAADDPSPRARAQTPRECRVQHQCDDTNEGHGRADIEHDTKLGEQLGTASGCGVQHGLKARFAHSREYGNAATSRSCVSLIWVAGIAVSGASNGASRTKRTSTSCTFGCLLATYTLWRYSASRLPTRPNASGTP